MLQKSDLSYLSLFSRKIWAKLPLKKWPYILHTLIKVCSVCKVRFQGAPRDSILLSFEEAKCAIVEYEPETESLQNVSMHYFQDESLKRGFRKMNALPLARVDPFQRCAAVLVYGAHFAVLPLRRASNSLRYIIFLLEFQLETLRFWRVTSLLFL